MAADPIYAAVKSGNLQSVTALLAADPGRLNGCHDDFNASAPLHVAAECGHVDIVKHLLSAGAQVDVLNQDRDTPLTYAVMKNRTEVVKILVKAGANVRHKNADGQTVREASEATKPAKHTSQEILDLCVY
jgi:ankyrin repeat protein